MNNRRGFTIFELLAVVVILGILGAASVAVMRVDSTGNYGAKTSAHSLANALQQARQRAISTGDEHFLQLTNVGSYVSGYTMYRSAAGGDTAVDSFQPFAEHVTVTINPEVNTTPEFTFEGNSASSFEFTLAGSSANYLVTVTAATGRAQVTGGY